ncbi:MAG: reverse transcriptase [Desulfobacteraceae bacterium]|nr:reverse transcriptase [Desulfobacteraceae bacterium]
MENIASDVVIDQAYEWLCRRREDYSDSNDVWNLRFDWDRIKPQIQADLLAGTYILGPVELIRGEEGTVELWSSTDALVLKAAAIVMNDDLKPVISEDCYHIAGNGGTKGAVCSVAENLEGNSFVFRTDVKSFYASIDHCILFWQLQGLISDGRVLDLLWESFHRTVYDGGFYRDVNRGIPLGSPVSPLLGALFLKPLDDLMSECGLFYARFMDDWVILAPTRWRLRGAVRLVNEILDVLKLDKHPDKTFIGRISRGFDFLGYQFSSCGLVGVAVKTVERFAERVSRLYEQGADSERIGEYARRWVRWVRSGIEGYMNWGGMGGMWSHPDLINEGLFSGQDVTTNICLFLYLSFWHVKDNTTP